MEVRNDAKVKNVQSRVPSLNSDVTAATLSQRIDRDQLAMGELRNELRGEFKVKNKCKMYESVRQPTTDLSRVESGVMEMSKVGVDKVVNGIVKEVLAKELKFKPVVFPPTEKQMKYEVAERKSKQAYVDRSERMKKEMY